MCKLYLRVIHGKDATFENILTKNFAHGHGKDATFENILTKNFAHGRSKIVAQGRYGLGGGSIV